MITNLTTHVFTYSMSLEISTLYFDTLYQLPHLKNAASVTCPSRGGAANLHALKFLQTPTSVYFNTFKCRPKWLFYLSSCFNKL